MHKLKLLILFLLFFGIACDKPESQKKILKKGVFQKHESIVYYSENGERTISVKVWENDSMFTSYNLFTMHDSINHKDTLVKYIGITTEHALNWSKESKFNLNFMQEVKETNPLGPLTYQKFSVSKN